MMNIAFPWLFTLAQAHRHAPIWRPDRGKSDDVDTVDGAAIQLRTVFTQQIKDIAAAAGGSGFRIFVIYFDDPSVNGFATRIWNSKHHFMIGINRGSIATLREIFYRPDCVAAIRGLLPSFSNRLDVELSRFMLSSAMWWLCYHEFGHIFRGHLGMLRSRAKLHATGAAEFWSKDEDYQSHVIEADEDTIAGRCIATELTRVADLYKAGTADPKRFLQDLALLTAYSIHIVFCLFDETHTDDDLDYPPPPVRSSIVNVQLFEQLGQYDPIAASRLTMLQGIGFGSELAKKIGIDSGKYDLKTVKTWHHKYMDDLSNMSSLVSDRIPLRKEARRNEGKIESVVNRYLELLYYQIFG